MTREPVRCLPMGEHAVLVDTGSWSAAHALTAWINDADLCATDVVPGARTVLVAGVGDLDAVAAVVAAWSASDAAGPDPLGPSDADVVVVPVVYDGPDLAFAARSWGMTEEQAIAAHTAVDYVVAFCGFAPGFPYLAGLPAELALPRLDTPRTRVPVGAVAVADAWTGIYPSASPGGWRLLGSTPLVLFDPSRQPPALLAPGTRVRLVAS